MLYSFPNFEPAQCSIFSFNSLCLTLIQVSYETGKVVWCSHLFENFPFCSDPHKGFSIINEAEVDVFLEFPCFLYDLTDFGNVTSFSSAFSKSRLYIWKFLVYVHPINLVKLYFYFQFVSDILRFLLRFLFSPVLFRSVLFNAQVFYDFSIYTSGFDF